MIAERCHWCGLHNGVHQHGCPNRPQPVCPYIVGGTTKHCTLAETRIRALETRLALAERVARIYTGRETATLIDTDTAVAEWLAEVNE